MKNNDTMMKVDETKNGRKKLMKTNPGSGKNIWTFTVSCWNMRNHDCKPVHVCMHACKHVCMCVWMHVCMYVCMYASMHACMHVHMHACMCEWMHACMLACMYVCMHECMYAGNAEGEENRANGISKSIKRSLSILIAINLK